MVQWSSKIAGRQASVAQRNYMSWLLTEQLRISSRWLRLLFLIARLNNDCAKELQISDSSEHSEH
jgi:hypothetical protein